MKVFLLILMCFLSINHASANEGVTWKVKFTKCEKYLGSENHTERCILNIDLSIKDINWRKVACYGDFKFKQLYKGKIEEHYQGFFGTVESLPYPNKNNVPLGNVFIYFPPDYEAIAPELNFLECKILD